MGAVAARHFLFVYSFFLFRHVDTEQDANADVAGTFLAPKTNQIWLRNHWLYFNCSYISNKEAIKWEVIYPSLSNNWEDFACQHHNMIMRHTVMGCSWLISPTCGQRPLLNLSTRTFFLHFAPMEMKPPWPGIKAVSSSCSFLRLWIHVLWPQQRGPCMGHRRLEKTMLVMHTTASSCTIVVSSRSRTNSTNPSLHGATNHVRNKQKFCATDLSTTCLAPDSVDPKRQTRSPVALLGLVFFFLRWHKRCGGGSMT